MMTLDVLTDQILSMKDICFSEEKLGTRVYKLDKGSLISFDLKKDEKVHVMDAWFAADSIFPWHKHEDSDETFILYQGEISILSDETHEVLTRLKIGVPYMIPKDTAHLLMVNKESRVMVIVIPPDKEM